ncbi:MAG: PKD domain-containing protein, partial [Anaerolineae bacterium]|nr:PKD domain-containing protein [Anaerolineae bacterium]
NSISTLTATTTAVVQQAAGGLAAWNDSPTTLGDVTVFTATVDAGTDLTYTWAFGDMVTGAGPAVTHTYAAPGVYTAVVTASNRVSAISAATPVTVAEAILGLSVVDDGPTALGHATTFTATIAAGTEVTYTWHPGDGVRGTRVVVMRASEPFVVAHTYPAPGTYSATFTAANSVGSEAALAVVVVEDAVAGLSAASNSPVVLGTPAWLTATIAAGSGVTYTWSPGDGTFAAGAVLSHTYPAVGTYTAVVTAQNQVSVLTATVEVSVVEPVRFVYLPLVIKGR